MATDYTTPVYHELGGNRLVIGQGGELLVSGGTVNGLLPGTGNVNWYVDSVNGAVGNSGASWGAAKALVSQAEALASSGDVIHVAPSHVETIDAAGDITLDTDGVTVVCYGQGDIMPTFTFDGADATPSIVVSASDCRWYGGKFVNNEASLNHMFDVKGDDFLLEGAFFTEGSATGLFFVVADTADGDSDRLTIRNCRFYAPTAGNMDAAIQLGKDHVGVRIEDCDIYGDWDNGGIEIPAGGNACLDLAIRRCRVVNLLAGAEAIDINGTSCTGEIVDCRLGTDAITTALNNGSLRCHGNTWASTTDQVNATPIPHEGGAYNPRLGYKVTKVSNLADGAGTDNLFTVNGRVLITSLTGEVTTVIGGAATVKITDTTNSVDLCAATTIDSDAVGTMYAMTSITANILNGTGATPVIGSVKNITGAQQVDVAIVGDAQAALTLAQVLDAADTGAITWVLTYIPLVDGATVVAAA